jgi:aspartate kinase
MQVLKQHGIIADKYVLSPHSVNLFVPVENREAAVRALHVLI